MGLAELLDIFRIVWHLCRSHFQVAVRLKAALDLVAKCLDIKIKALKLLRLDVATAAAATTGADIQGPKQSAREAASHNDR
uniref:Uncharacterized protein n=1 Tax=Oryza brachyantha TaxID=4533 RepID=J3LUI2_ORYBR